MFTANSMNCLCEALGVALPGNGTILAATPERAGLARRAAAQLLDLVRAETKVPRHRDERIDRQRDGARRRDGRIDDTILRSRARARSGYRVSLSRINEVAERVPQLAKISPAWDEHRQWHMQDVHEAGGTAILAGVPGGRALLDVDAPTAGGRRLRDALSGAKYKSGCIRPIDRAHAPRGALCALFGNLAPKDL